MSRPLFRETTFYGRQEQSTCFRTSVREVLFGVCRFKFRDVGFGQGTLQVDLNIGRV